MFDAASKREMLQWHLMRMCDWYQMNTLNDQRAPEGGVMTLTHVRLQNENQPVRLQSPCRCPEANMQNCNTRLIATNKPTRHKPFENSQGFPPKDLVRSFSFVVAGLLHAHTAWTDRFKMWTTTAFWLIINPVMHHAPSSSSWKG